mmetsp:Transcript_6709/g.13313  ORF Transcript_6709/g.13313 Transcript_6709/m.13313 type:complete len:172 (-) Transcript_6709:88-603(-)
MVYFIRLNGSSNCYYNVPQMAAVVLERLVCRSTMVRRWIADIADSHNMRALLSSMAQANKENNFFEPLGSLLKVIREDTSSEQPSGSEEKSNNPIPASLQIMLSDGKGTSATGSKQPLRVGTEVRLLGLKTQKYNGLIATITAPLDSGERYAIQLRDGKKVKIKSANVVAV